VALDGIATFVAGYATFVGLAKLISTFVAGCATSVGLAKLISTFVADCATFVGLVKLIATFVDPCWHAPLWIFSHMCDTILMTRFCNNSIVKK
jgi:uncharacterized membrane-anchored protein